MSSSYLDVLFGSGYCDGGKCSDGICRAGGNSACLRASYRTDSLDSYSILDDSVISSSGGTSSPVSTDSEIVAATTEECSYGSWTTNLVYVLMFVIVVAVMFVIVYWTILGKKT